MSGGEGPVTPDVRPEADGFLVTIHGSRASADAVLEAVAIMTENGANEGTGYVIWDFLQATDFDRQIPDLHRVAMRAQLQLGFGRSTRIAALVDASGAGEQVMQEYLDVRAALAKAVYDQPRFRTFASIDDARAWIDESA